MSFLYAGFREEEMQLLLWSKDVIKELTTDQSTYDQALDIIKGSQSLECLSYKQTDEEDIRTLQVGKLANFPNLKKVHYSGFVNFICPSEKFELPSVQELNIQMNSTEDVIPIDQLVQFLYSCPNLKLMYLQQHAMQHHVTLMLTFPHIRFHINGYSSKAIIDLRKAYFAMNLDRLEISPVSFGDDMLNAQALVYNKFGASIDPKNTFMLKEFLTPFLSSFRSKNRSDDYYGRPIDLGPIFDFHPNLLRVLLSDFNSLLMVISSFHHISEYNLDTAEKIFELQMKSGISEWFKEAYERQILTEKGTPANPDEVKMTYQQYYHILSGGQ
ncbi:hypothetical protein FGO68_gene3477 [Halteria grandinella]|uniref:Uncharacterized protein n=1 Tax=Halteria grandinella TaxID=5974 RepID=A0A8J8T5S9_HALGN|nr:hypothetical protein FGO68_gene3477 [Halteria grandinella]